MPYRKEEKKLKKKDTIKKKKTPKITSLWQLARIGIWSFLIHAVWQARESWAREAERNSRLSREGHGQIVELLIYDVTVGVFVDVDYQPASANANAKTKYIE